MTLVLATSLFFAGIVVALLNLARVQAIDVRLHLAATEALHEANSELENARLLLSASNYDAQGQNLILRDALAQPDSRIPGTQVEVSLLPGAGANWFQLTARVPYADDYERVVSRPVREVDYISSYLFFSDDSMGFAAKKVDGAIHSNQYIDFRFAGGEYGPGVTAVNGVNYYDGATTTNTNLLGHFDPSADPVDFGSVTGPQSDIDAIQQGASLAFSFDATADTHVFFETSAGNQTLRIQRWKDGVKLSEVTTSPPADGVLYFEGDVTVEGTVLDRLTIASRSSITISDSIVYRDSGGDPAFLNGNDSTQPYVPNPDYGNDAALGLVALNDIVVSSSVSDSFEINASLVALTGLVAVDSWLSGDYSSFLKTSYRLLGGLISAQRSALVITSGGSIVSGFQTGVARFDGALTNRPPPLFPRVWKPRFLSSRITK